MQNKHIVLIGLNFYMERHGGDKNFWIELLPILAAKLKKITILSVRDNPVSDENFSIADCEIAIKYLSPKILEIGENKKKRLIKQKGGFPAFWGCIEKFLNVKMILRELKRLYQKEQYDYVHLMDNMGIANRIISRHALSDASVSAMAYQGKNRLIYDNYLLLSYKCPNLIVVPYSETYTQKLLKIGISRKQIKHIPWGVKLNNYFQLRGENKNLKLRLSIAPDKNLFLWTGYIQQIQRKDFLFAYRCAIRSLKRGLDGIFYFAFKSTKIAKEFEYLHNPKQGIYVKATTVDEFRLLKKAADVFYSPVCNKKVILAPPLTWLEILNEGVPIITTDVGGVDEVIENGKTGFIAKSENEIVERIFDISRCYKEMQESCYKKVQEKYDIEKTAEEYLNLWNVGENNGI